MTLVQALDRLLKAQISRSQVAVEEFIRGAGLELVDVSQRLEETELALTAAKDESDQLRDQLQEHKAENDRLNAKLVDKARQLEEAQSRIELTSDELKSMQASHAAKLEQVATQHQRELTMALEAQRKAMELEKHSALDHQENRLKQQHASSLAEVNASQTKLQTSLKRIQEELAAARDREYAMALHLKEAQAENKANQGQLARQEAIIDENRNALASAQRAQDDLIAAVKQQVTANTDDVEARLRTLVSTAESVTHALATAQQRLSEGQISEPKMTRPKD